MKPHFFLPSFVILVCLSASTVLAAPNGPYVVVATQGTSQDTVGVSWENVSAASGYRVFRSRYINAQGELVGSTSVNSFFDSSAVPGVPYFYSVEAFDDAGETFSSNQVLGFRGTAGSAPADRDGDGVSDALEAADETDPNDPGSHHSYGFSPLFVRYNTYINQKTYLELNTRAAEAVVVGIEVFDNSGALINETAVLLEADEQVDVDVNEIAGKDSSYGSLKLTFPTGKEVMARTSTYRIVDGTIEYAHSRLARQAAFGRQYAIANGMDPSNADELVQTWAEITNTSDTTQVVTHNIFRKNGQRISSRRISVPAYGAVDLPAGVQFGAGTYLNEITPEDGSAKLLFSVARYGTQTPTAADNRVFSFGTVSHGKAGTAAVQYAHISDQKGACWSQANWLEIANVRTVPVTAYISVYGRNGSLVTSTEVEIPAKAQRHLYMNAALAGWEHGTVAVASLTPGSLIASSALYYEDCEFQNTQTAVLSAARMPGKASILGTYNTFLDMENMAYVASAHSDVSAVSVYTYRGSDTISIQQVIVSTNDSVEQNLNDVVFATSKNSSGLVRFQAPADNTIVATIIRQRQHTDGRMNFAFDASPR